MDIIPCAILTATALQAILPTTPHIPKMNPSSKPIVSLKACESKRSAKLTSWINSTFKAHFDNIDNIKSIAASSMK